MAIISREDAKGFGGEQSVSYQSAASLTAVPLASLHHNLNFSSREEIVAGKKNTNSSLSMYNNVTLYQGIDVNLGGIFTSSDTSDGRNTKSTQTNVGATLTPNRKIAINVMYNGQNTKTSGGESPENRTYLRTGVISLAYTPLQRLYLFGSYQVDSSDTTGRRNFLNYSANWSPFPDGNLHLNFFYNESLQSDGASVRTIVPSIRWNMNSFSYLNFSFQNIKNDTKTQKTDSYIYSGEARISF
jgi:hypothetical protein